MPNAIYADKRTDSITGMASIFKSVRFSSHRAYDSKAVSEEADPQFAWPV